MGLVAPRRVGSSWTNVSCVKQADSLPLSHLGEPLNLGMVLMLKLNFSVCWSRTESHKVFGEVEKDSFIALPGEGGPCGLLPLKLNVPTH